MRIHAAEHRSGARFVPELPSKTAHPVPHLSCPIMLPYRSLTVIGPKPALSRRKGSKSLPGIGLRALTDHPKARRSGPRRGDRPAARPLSSRNLLFFGLHLRVSQRDRQPWMQLVNGKPVRVVSLKDRLWGFDSEEGLASSSPAYAAARMEAAYFTLRA